MMIVKVPLCVVRDPEGRSHYLYEGSHVTMADKAEVDRLVEGGFVAEVSELETVEDAETV